MNSKCSDAIVYRDTERQESPLSRKFLTVVVSVVQEATGGAEIQTPAPDAPARVFNDDMLLHNAGPSVGVSSGNSLHRLQGHKYDVHNYSVPNFAWCVY